MRGGIAVWRWRWRCSHGKRSAFDWHPTKAMNRSIKCPPLSSVDSPDIWIPSTSTASSISHPTSSFQTNEQIATMLDGKTIAEDMKSRIAREILEMKKSIGRTPGLGIILVGKREDSQVFIHAKMKACKKVGIASVVAQLSEDCNEDEVCDAVSRMNEDQSIHGVIVQLPLPKHMNEEKILNGMSLQKDVDGFHPRNVGDLAIRGREPLFIPCAAKACLEMLLSYGFELKGAKAAVIGRSKIGGLPTSLLLQRHHVTVSVVHAFTQNPEQLTSEADIVVSDVGVPNLVRGHWLKPGAVVIDMGSNSIKDDRSVKGHRLVGDVCYEEAIRKVSAITPVPGGIGPVTISVLLSNTLDSAKKCTITPEGGLLSIMSLAFAVLDVKQKPHLTGDSNTCHFSLLWVKCIRFPSENYRACTPTLTPCAPIIYFYPLCVSGEEI